MSILSQVPHSEDRRGPPPPPCRGFLLALESATTSDHLSFLHQVRRVATRAAALLMPLGVIHLSRRQRLACRRQRASIGASYYGSRLMPRIKRRVKKRIRIIRPPYRPPEELPTQIGLPTLAKLLGIEITAARELVECGIILRGNPGLYVLEHSVASYCAHLRKIAWRQGR